MHVVWLGGEVSLTLIVGSRTRASVSTSAIRASKRPWLIPPHGSSHLGGLSCRLPPFGSRTLSLWGWSLSLPDFFGGIVFPVPGCRFNTFGERRIFEDPYEAFLRFIGRWILIFLLECLVLRQ